MHRTQKTALVRKKIKNPTYIVAQKILLGGKKSTHVTNELAPSHAYRNIQMELANTQTWEIIVQ